MSVIIRTRDHRQVAGEAEERILIATSMISYDGSVEEFFQEKTGAEGDEGLERTNETNEAVMSVIIRMRDPRQLEDEAEERILIATSMTSNDGSIEELFQVVNGAEGAGGMERLVGQREPLSLEDVIIEEFDDSRMDNNDLQ